MLSVLIGPEILVGKPLTQFWEGFIMILINNGNSVTYWVSYYVEGSQSFAFTFPCGGCRAEFMTQPYGAQDYNSYNSVDVYSLMGIYHATR